MRCRFPRGCLVVCLGCAAPRRLPRAFDGVHERTYEYDYKRGGELRYAFCDGVRIAQYGSENKGRNVWVRDYATAQALDGRAPEEAYVEHRYEYDSAGQLVKRSRSAVIDPHSPDSEHKMSKSTDVENQVQALNTFVSTGAYTLTYSYDADGNRTATVTPYGTSHAVYDGAGHVVRRETCSTGEDKSIVSTYSYDVMGQLVRAQVGDIVSTWRFDASGRVSGYREKTQKGTGGKNRQTAFRRYRPFEISRRKHAFDFQSAGVGKPFGSVLGLRHLYIRVSDVYVF